VLEPSPSYSSSSSSSTKSPSIALLGPQKLGSAFFVRHFGLRFLVVGGGCGCFICIALVVGTAAIVVVGTAAITSSSLRFQPPLFG